MFLGGEACQGKTNWLVCPTWGVAKKGGAGCRNRTQKQEDKQNRKTGLGALLESKKDGGSRWGEATRLGETERGQVEKKRGKKEKKRLSGGDQKNLVKKSISKVRVGGS